MNPLTGPSLGVRLDANIARTNSPDFPGLLLLGSAIWYGAAVPKRKTPIT
jgi:hypothetical protein